MESGSYHNDILDPLRAGSAILTSQCEDYVQNILDSYCRARAQWANRKSVTPVTIGIAEVYV
jgi:hypothetical protein